MSSTDLTCRAPRRRHDVMGNAATNGIDYLEVLDDPRDPASERQRRLVVYFLNKLGGMQIKPANVRITGGRRVRDLRVTGVTVCAERLRRREDVDDCMVVTVDRPGDFSTYKLCLVELDADGHPTDQPLKGFDPRYSCIDFSFKAGCPSNLDCKQEQICPPEQRVRPEVSYLAKDYASFRRLILDRLALIMPDWQERHVPDLGITLVELLAYAGDYLSYYQDAVGTEAYLNTARQRISVRRHARLVDYLMHEGCNARAWVCVETSAAHLEIDPAEIYFVAGDDLPTATVLASDDLRSVPEGRYRVFEPLLEPTGSVELSEADLKDPICFVARLQHHPTPAIIRLQAMLSAESRRLLDAHTGSGVPSKELIASLIDDLNIRLYGPSLRMLLTGTTHGDADQDLTWQNRAMLEELFPQSLAHRRRAGESLSFFKAHNEIHFYTWGDIECCLPKGATTATLLDTWDSPIEPEQQQPPQEQTRRRKKAGLEDVEPPADPCRWKRKLANLQPGDILIFEELIGPRTGNPADADPAHRHAVRLTRVTYSVDPLYSATVETGGKTQERDRPVVEIEWAAEDALPFPLCISAIGPAPECALLANISVARGNVILVDHGRRIEDETLGTVPTGATTAHCIEEGMPAEVEIAPGRFEPVLQQGPLTHYQPLSQGLPAARMLTQDPRKAVPTLSVFSTPVLISQDQAATSRTPQATSLFTLAELRQPASTLARLQNPSAAADHALRDRLSAGVRGILTTNAAGDAKQASAALGDELTTLLEQWSAVRDLLGSQADDRHVVAEPDNAGRAHLRFGDGELGQRPEAGAIFSARYRVGIGSPGNVGAEAIAYSVFRAQKQNEITRVRNPLPAQGGIDSEPLAEVKMLAPYAFRFRTELRRAITADDYAQVVMLGFKKSVQRASAALRWSGSWYEAQVAVDPLGQVEASATLLREVEDYLYPYRRMGHDLAVRAATYVPLEVELLVCVKSTYLRGHVEAALRERLSNRRLADGTLGFFHPDNLTFGDGVRLSTLVATAQAEPGVESVTVIRLNRLFEKPNHEIENGILPLGPLEAARMDNDPSIPEHGVLRLDVRGGR